MTAPFDNQQQVCVLGLGYIGLPLATLLATEGVRVLGVDTNPKVIRTLQSGELHIVEPGLHALVSGGIHSGRLRLAPQPEPSDVFIICVPTPFREDHKADLSHVEKAAESLLPHLRPGVTVIIESTCPSGTTRDVVLPILERSGLQQGKNLFVAYCPERVLPGKILKELVDNDRVIGGIDAASTQKAKALYETFVSGALHETDCDTAEMVKLVENSYRDVSIAFANELSIICGKLQLDVWQVIELANKHPRVKILSPGPGVGGHCIAVDPWFIVEKATQEAQLIRTARTVNDSMPEHIAQRVDKAIQGITQPKIACLGLSYKANVDDIRESPAMEVVHLLMQRGYTVVCSDPYVSKAEGLTLADLPDALAEAHCAVLLVDHKDFLQIDWHKAVQRMARIQIIDTRGVLPKDLSASVQDPQPINS